MFAWKCLPIGSQKKKNISCGENRQAGLSGEGGLSQSYKNGTTCDHCMELSGTLERLAAL